MAEHDKTAHVWKLIEKLDICMLATHDGKAIRARPMSSHPKHEDNAIWFLTDVDAHKDEEIKRDPSVGVFYQTGSDFVSLSGTAEVSNDRAKIKELFDTSAKAWWDDANDPRIRVLKVTPTMAEYWDGPGKVVAIAKMLTAAATGGRPNIGENEKVRM
jgi:general stress protein 26